MWFLWLGGNWSTCDSTAGYYYHLFVDQASEIYFCPKSKFRHLNLISLLMLWVSMNEFVIYCLIYLWFYQINSIKNDLIQVLNFSSTPSVPYSTNNIRIMLEALINMGKNLSSMVSIYTLWFFLESISIITVSGFSSCESWELYGVSLKASCWNISWIFSWRKARIS